MSDERPDAGGSEPVGSLAEEAGRLIAALGDWARDQGPGLGAGMASAAKDLDDHLATGAAECTYCPLCRTVHTLRTISPEVREQLSVAAGALLQAGTGLLASLAASQQPPRSGRRGSSSVERIDLDDPDQDPDDVPADDGREV